MATKHLLNWKEFSDYEIKGILQTAQDIKKNPENYRNALAHKTLIMLFQKTSTRTRVSFEVAMTELGGHAIFLDWKTTNFDLTEMEYETGYLSTNSHAIMARVMKFDDLLAMEKGCTVPLINGCCNRYHPAQAMADMLTIKEDRGELAGANLTYIGVHNNVVNSLMALCAVFDVNLTLVCPIVPEGSVDAEYKNRLQQKGLLTETLEVKAAVAEADYVYTDTWVDMEFFSDPAKQAMKDERVNKMLPFQINKELMKDSKAKIMHDMPIHTGYEISKDMVKSEYSIIFKQAENRLHGQKGLLVTLMI